MALGLVFIPRRCHVRQTTTLRYVHAYTYSQIATHMGCAEATVKDRLRQSRRRLAAALRRDERSVALAG